MAYLSELFASGPPPMALGGLFPREVPELDPSRSHGGSFMTGLINSIGSAFTLPGDQALGKGVPTFPTDMSLEHGLRVADLAGLAMTGGLAGTGPGGFAVGSGPIRKTPGLPMDEASRLARARELGFDPTQTFYHATQHDFPAFDKKKAAGMGAGLGLKERAVFLTDNPAQADSYLAGGYVSANAPSAVEHGVAPLQGNPDVGRWYAPNANVIPAHVRGLDNFQFWETYGRGYDPDFVKQALKEAKAEGAPGVVFDNMRDPGILDTIGPVGNPRSPSRVVAVFDPRDIRSKFAAFDLAKRNSADLLASIGALAATPLGSMFAQSQQPVQ